MACILYQSFSLTILGTHIRSISLSLPYVHVPLCLYLTSVHSLSLSHSLVHRCTTLLVSICQNLYLSFFQRLSSSSSFKIHHEMLLFCFRHNLFFTLFLFTWSALLICNGRTSLGIINETFYQITHKGQKSQSTASFNISHFSLSRYLFLRRYTSIYVCKRGHFRPLFLYFRLSNW